MQEIPPQAEDAYKRPHKLSVNITFLAFESGAVLFYKQLKSLS